MESKKVAFFSYRYSDSRQLVLKKIHPPLARVFGDDHIIIDHYEFGFAPNQEIPETELRETIFNTVSGCDLVLVFIGSQWERIIYQNRHSTTDWVRFELEAAHELNKPLLPVLLNGVDMPEADYLPMIVQDDFYRYGPVELYTDARFDADIKQLINVLSMYFTWGYLPEKRIEASPAPAAPSPNWFLQLANVNWATAAVVALLLLVTLITTFDMPLPEFQPWRLPIARTSLTPMLKWLCGFLPDACQASSTVGVKLSGLVGVNFAPTTILSVVVTLAAYVGVTIPKQLKGIRVDPVALLILIGGLCFAFYTSGDRLFGMTIHLLFAYMVMLSDEFKEDHFLLALGMVSLLFSLLMLGIESTVNRAPSTFRSTLVAWTAAVFTRLVWRDWLATGLVFIIGVLALKYGLFESLVAMVDAVSNFVGSLRF